MGEEYQLKKLYEQMLKGNVEHKPTNKPRTLAEAYEKKLVTERTTFFAKDNNKYTTLGIVDDPDEANDIKNNIKSFSILAITTQMLEEAGWAPNNPILSSRKLGSLALQKEIDTLDLSNIANNKKAFKNLQKYIFGEKSGKKFNVIDALVEGLESVLSDSKKTSSENFKGFIKSLIPQVGRIEGTDVGPGEMAITLLTNATKPSEKGDLNFDGTIVEVKASSYGKEEKLSGAALGYAKYASGGALQAAIDNTLRTKETTPDRNLYKVKKTYDEAIEALKTNSSLIPFTPQFFEDLTNLNQLIVKKNPEEFKNKFKTLFGMDLDVRNPNVLEGVKTLVKNSYISKKESTIDLLQNPKQNDVFQNIKQQLYTGSGLLGKAKATYRFLTTPTTPKPTEEKPSLVIAFQDFFFSDLGFSPQQLAAVLLEARPYKNHTEGLLQSIQSALVEDGYLKRLQRQDSSALKGLVFALHVLEYARAEGFKYLMLFNYSNGSALAIPAKTSYKDLLSFYENRKQEIAFNFDFVGRQGAHKLALR